MLVSDIFGNISAHQIEGMMIHDNMADYFDFLNLHGFKRMHEYHFLNETCNMRGIHRYYINHYNMLIDEKEINAKNVIPSTWYDYSRQQVSTDAKKQAVKAMIEKWVKWEKDTKTIYEKAYKDLCEINEIATAMKIKELICDVDMELKYAQRLHIKLESMEYDMCAIEFMQDELHEYYKEKEKNLGVYIC